MVAVFAETRREAVASVERANHAWSHRMREGEGAVIVTVAEPRGLGVIEATLDGGVDVVLPMLDATCMKIASVGRRVFRPTSAAGDADSAAGVLADRLWLDTLEAFDGEDR